MHGDQTETNVHDGVTQELACHTSDGVSGRTENGVESENSTAVPTNIDEVTVTWSWDELKLAQRSDPEIGLIIE